MWTALERIIPDVRKRTEVELVATPLTHEFFNRRFKGEDSPTVSFASCPRQNDRENSRMGTRCTYLGGLYTGRIFVACYLWTRLSPSITVCKTLQI